jgi:disulfide oxidoreductase YuzD
MVSPNRFYTYAYLREDGTPYYIGKGTDNRAFLQLNHKVKTPDKNRVLILKNNLSESEANTHEKYMIAIFGRKDLRTGILRNLTDGGEGVSGLKHSEKTKTKMRKPNTKEHNEKVSAAIKRKWENGEYDRERYSKREKGKKHNEEIKNKISASLKKYYENNKKVITEEQKIKMSDALRQKYKNGEMKYFYPNHKGTRWWNDGQKNKRAVECPGNGWILGRL